MFFFYNIRPWFQFELDLCWFCDNLSSGPYYCDVGADKILSEGHHKIIILFQAHTIVV